MLLQIGFVAFLTAFVSSTNAFSFWSLSPDARHPFVPFGFSSSSSTLLMCTGADVCEALSGIPPAESEGSSYVFSIEDNSVERFATWRNENGTDVVRVCGGRDLCQHSSVLSLADGMSPSSDALVVSVDGADVFWIEPDSLAVYGCNGRNLCDVGSIFQYPAGLAMVEEWGDQFALNWTTNDATDICSLEPFICSDDWVTNVNLVALGIEGRIPSEMGLLTRATLFRMDQNKLYGDIPELFGLLNDVTQFFVYANDLNGTLPTTIGQMTSLVDFRVNDNDMTGTIPSELGLCSDISRLYTFSNEFTGSIAPEIGANMPSLSSLQMHNCNLEGQFPATFANSPLLTLSVNTNQLTGTLPTELAQLSDIVYFKFYDNSIHGTLPTEYGAFTRVKQFMVNSNDLHGDIPREYVNMTSAQYFWLDRNSFNGTLDAWLDDLPELTSCELGVNDWACPIMFNTTTSPCWTGLQFQCP